MPRPPSIRVLIATLAVVPVLLLAVALFSLLAVSTQEISERLGNSLVDNATTHVRSDVATFLGNAVRVSDLYERRVRAGLLPTRGLEAWERPQLDDLSVNTSVASICFGAVNGETTWLLRRPSYTEVGRVAPDGTAVELRIDPQTGTIDPNPVRTYTYDPRQRPWYKTAIDANSPVWTPVYFWYGDAGADSETGAGYTRPIHAPDGSLAGVLVVDVTLGGISSFLASLQFSSAGSIFIIDSESKLVAASHGAVNSAEGERLPLASSTHPSARAVAAALHNAPHGTEHTFRVQIDGRPARARVSPLRPYPGIDWSIVAVIPESVFLADAQAMQRRALLLSIVAGVGGLALALILASYLTRPFLALVDHVRRVGKGDFDSRLHLKSARELQALSTELNRMAASLKEHVELQHSLAVAMQVQQDLLPSGAPKTPGLDIAGQSKYCDATGGDYYDFIDVSDLPGGRVLIAVGDVMGHGIAAALLMATARAALRAHSWRFGSLGELMDRVNTVLAREARHGRFMTMILVIVDPLDGVVRWASAGHDPPIIYEPHADRFIEVEGGDVPLGVIEETQYEEYTIPALAPGAVVFIGTDGIWEAANAEGAMFGKDRLRDLIRAMPRASSAEIARRVQDELARFCGEQRPQDDVTLVVIRLENIPSSPDSGEHADARAPIQAPAHA